MVLLVLGEEAPEYVCWLALWNGRLSKPIILAE